jgi:hypothetical protein
MSWFFRKNVISSPVVKAKSDKLYKLVVRDAKKKIKSGELIDSYSFEMYLETIDAAYAHVKNDIISATQTADYDSIRAAKLAETRQLLDFFNLDHAELARLYQIVLKKAKDAERINDLKQEKLSSVDIAKLRENFEELIKKEKEK